MIEVQNDERSNKSRTMTEERPIHVSGIRPYEISQHYITIYYTIGALIVLFPL